MHKIIEGIRQRLQRNVFNNEASVSNSIVQPILRELGWDTSDPEIVMSEYSLEGRRVDYALCPSPTKPSVFIEIKQVGQADGAERQLFEYSFHVGIPLAVLTDGRVWSFFVPGEQGSYQDRRAYKLDLLERDTDQIVARFERYLAFGRVKTGEAADAAKQDYRNVAREREAENALPEAWESLVAEPDPLLVELVTDKVATMKGFRPSPEAVARFLQRLGSAAPESQITSESTQSRRRRDVRIVTPTQQPPAPFNTQLGKHTFVFRGKSYQSRNAIETLTTILLLLSEEDRTFPQRLAERTRNNPRRRYIARSPQELYPHNPELYSKGRELIPGWWLDTNLSNQSKMKIIRMACEVANIRLGQELQVSLD